MTSIQKAARGTLVAGMMAGTLLGVASCGDYALLTAIIKVQDKSAATPNIQPREFISQCRMTVKDGSGKEVLRDFLLNPDTVANPGDQARLQGPCGRNSTTGQPFPWSYSTSNVTGSFVFEFSGLDSTGKAIQTGKSCLKDMTTSEPRCAQGSNPGDVVPAKPYPPEIMLFIKTE